MKTYLEKYGVKMVKKHLLNTTTGRYHKVYTADYANSAISVFNYKQFCHDLGIGFKDFPFRIVDKNGWKLHATPTIDELDNFLNQK